MSEQQEAILQFLDAIYPSVCSPTEIGREVGGPGKHSSWASPKCLSMTDRGWLERTPIGHYRITNAGKAALAKARGDDL